ncbi:SURF1 family protein [Variovorax sp. OV329]|uniref:SURF1 family protein n=1 Tax=Variovorax sp. OV329 TaxID=1882825 RepID=UPI0008EFE341|nr:SURF1 family protein [Variovorax sp. OV329]SFM76503.1 Cytochrome oxidase assembly protein ShyY1 [Variovorax sp. OV329]
MSTAAPFQSAQAPARTRKRGHTLLFAVVALALIALGIALGNWQLRRAAQKEALQAQIEAQGLQPVLDQAEFLALPKPVDALHRRVRLRGLWLASQTVYLDNRQMHGIPGFYVLTPLALEGSNETVMVQRGWIQRNFNDRTQLAPVQTPGGLVEVEALIAPPPAHLLELGKEPPAAPAAGSAAATPAAEAATAPAQGSAGAAPPAGAAAAAAAGSSPIRQNLDLDAFRTQTGLPLRTELSLQEIGSASQGLQRDWPAPALGIDRHYGYAFQWFGLAALVAVLYVWFQFIVPFRRARRQRRG